MCGIAGFVVVEGGRCCLDPDSLVRAMTEQLRHRGPDHQGTWLEEDKTVAFGHRRLSIIDTSASGNQPMVSSSGRYVIVFNGEIYNYPALRNSLQSEGEQLAFRGHSDTEVMLACFEKWGISRSLKRFNGMFAFALWDRQERVLSLSRDRLGEKPLYYTLRNGNLVFGSELKALLVHPSFNRAFDREALRSYFRCGFIPAPMSIYEGTFKLMPGTWLEIRQGHPTAVQTHVYWSARATAEACSARLFAGSDEDAVDETEALLLRAVRSRMISDVPLGSFLSGGIDSSTVTSMMQAQCSQPVRSFAIGFSDERLNEAPHAAAVARHLQTDHTELIVNQKDAQAVIPRLPVLYDEPFADSSQIPTFVLAELARRYVTVSLSGDGGDEVFGGYSRYLWGYNLWSVFGSMPGWARRGVAKTAVRMAHIDGHLEAVIRFLPRGLRVNQPKDKLLQLAAMLSGGTFEQMYSGLITFWPRIDIVLGQYERAEARCPPIQLHECYRKMMLCDLVNYLPNDIMVKVDRATMGVSLEARAPFLDHEVLEFVWTLPSRMFFRNGRARWLLREVLKRRVPEHLFHRPKAGFAVPLGEWLRGDLRGWAEDLLDEKRQRECGILDVGAVQRLWKEHLSGAHDRSSIMWAILMFEAWLRQQDVLS